MDLPLDITEWSSDQIVAAIRDLLPEGQDFVHGWVGGEYEVRFETPSEDGPPTVVWRMANLSMESALFGAYGHLWCHRQPVPVEGSAWAPQENRPTRAAVQKKALELADPPDLDPEEVAAVYGMVRKDQ